VASNVTGTGQTIAVYELSAYDPGDLATYLNCYGLNPTITPVSVDGGPTGAYDDEPTLDIEEVAAMAPGATIEIYRDRTTAPDNRCVPADRRRRHRVDRLHVVGTCESDPSGDPAAEQPIFEQMAPRSDRRVGGR